MIDDLDNVLDGTVSTAKPIDPTVFDLMEKVADLQAKLLEAHPAMPTLLRSIHTQILQDPELVTCLSEEQIGIIVSGLSKQTMTEIATTVSKPAAAATLKKQLKAAGGSSTDLF